MERQKGRILGHCGTVEVFERFTVFCARARDDDDGIVGFIGLADLLYRFADGDGAARIGIHGFVRAIPGNRGVALGCKMEDRIGPLFGDDPLDALRIAHIAFGEPDALIELVQIDRRFVVGAERANASLLKHFHHVRADHSARTRYQNRHAISLFPVCGRPAVFP